MIEKYVDVLMRVTESEAPRLLAEKNAEIVIRTANSRYTPFIKGTITKIANDSSDADTLFNQVMSVLQGQTQGIEGIRKELSGFAGQINEVSNAAQNMSSQMQTILSGSDILKKMSYLNVGVTLANTAVDIVGFAIISKKIESLEDTIEEVKKGIADLQNDVDGIATRQINDIVRRAEELDSEYWAITDKVIREATIEVDDINKLISRYYAYIDSITKDMIAGALDTQLTVCLINRLLPEYTILMCELVSRMYYQNGHFDENSIHKHTKLYDLVNRKEVLTKLYDYYFLEQNLSGLETTDAINTSIMLGIKGKTQVADQLVIIKELKTKERVDEFNAAIDKIVAEDCEDIIREVLQQSKI